MPCEIFYLFFSARTDSMKYAHWFCVERHMFCHDLSHSSTDPLKTVASPHSLGMVRMEDIIQRKKINRSIDKNVADILAHQWINVNKKCIWCGVSFDFQVFPSKNVHFTKNGFIFRLTINKSHSSENNRKQTA